jgi:hypothetical protein
MRTSCADAQAIAVGSGTAHRSSAFAVTSAVPITHRCESWWTRADALRVGPLFEIKLAPTLVVTTVDAAGTVERRRPGRRSRS